MKKDKSIVTVIIPTYNRSGYIVDAIDSILRQIYRPIDLIVIDDGSTDNTDVIVSKYIDEYTNDDSVRIRYVNKKNEGAPVARNLGLEMAFGDYVTFLDSDDWIKEDKILVQVKHLRMNPDCDVSVCQVEFVYPNENNKPPKIDISAYPIGKKGVASLKYVMKNHVAPNSTLIKTSVARKAKGFDSDLRHGQDVSFHIRLAIIGANFCVINRILASQRMHKGVRITSEANTDTDIEYPLYFNDRIRRYSISCGKYTRSIEDLLSARLIQVGLSSLKSGNEEKAELCIQEAAQCGRTRYRILEMAVTVKSVRWILSIYAILSEKLGLLRRKSVSAVWRMFASTSVHL